MAVEVILGIVLALALVGFAVTKRRGRLGPEEAQAALRQGGILVDVRTPDEFAAGHLPRAINVPLDQLAEQMEMRVPVKDAVVLCYCASGMRSGAAIRQLRRLGYERVYNLGSYRQAGRILEG